MRKFDFTVKTPEKMVRDGFAAHLVNEPANIVPDGMIPRDIDVIFVQN